MARWTIRGYSNQVRLFLFLVVFFLVMQSALNFNLLFRARDSLAGAARARALVVADRLASELPRGDARVAPGHLARLARGRDLSEVSVLAPDGAVRAASGGPAVFGDRDADHAGLSDRARRGFASGRVEVLVEIPWRGPGRLVVFHPVLDPESGRPASLLKVVMVPGDLVRLTQRIRLFAVVQAVGVTAVLLLTFAFIRWMLRPYRLLVRTAGQALAIRATEAQAVQAPEGLVEAFQGVVDAMNRQEAEIEALRREGPLAGPAVRNMPSGLVATGQDGAVTALNPAAERILEVRSETAVGRDYREVLSRCPELVGLVRECLERRTSRRRVLVRVPGSDGASSHLGASVSPIEGASRSGEGALCLFSDLTEIRQVEERVRLRENLAEVGQLSAGIAHEVRNALATILGYAKLASRSGEREGREHAAAIGREVEEIRGVLEDYLQFARPLSLHVERVDLGAMVRDVIATLRQDGRAEGRQVVVEGTFSQVDADEALLRQALANLVRNALEAAGDGGRVAVRGSLTEDGARLEVFDDGPGVPPEVDPEDLFRPFFTTKRQGTGLGLSLARKTVVYHDGRLTVDRGPWGGARFTMILPPAAGVQKLDAQGASGGGTF